MQPTPERALAASRVLVAALAVVVVALAAILAMTVPYHAADALAFGEWSRLIGEHGRLRFEGISDLTYHRPLFYVLQGAAWWLIGFSEPVGRLLSLGFSVVLLGALAILVGRRPLGWASLGAVLLLLLTPDYLRAIAAGLSDVPVAACLALTAALLWRRAAGPATAALVTAAAAASVLAKPTALIPLASLALAQLVGERATVRERAVWGVAPIAAGVALALVYDLLQARHLGIGLVRFLNGGVTGGFYAGEASQARWDALLALQWLGPELRPLLAFAALYALARVVGVKHRWAAIVAAPAAILIALLLPAAADDAPGVTVERATEPGLALAALLVTAVVLIASAWADADEWPSRTWLARLLVWALPPLAAWIVYVPYDSRLASTAWPALLALAAVTAAPGLSVLARRVPAAAVGVVVAAALGVSVAAYELDGLGEQGWSRYVRLGAAVFDPDRALGVVEPEFAAAKTAVDGALPDEGRVLSPEGRFRFYYPGRVSQSYPTGCADLRGYDVFVLLTRGPGERYMEEVVGVPADPPHWAACAAPRLTQLTDGENGYAVFRVARG